MSYQTGSAIDLDDLLSKLMTFATGTPGWTQDEFDVVNGKWALHKGDVYVSARWDPATPTHMSLHQALGFTPGQEPGDHPDDSGYGYNTDNSRNSTSLSNERHVDSIDDGPFSTYYFFEDDNYLHVVVQVRSGVYRHFGFGEITKTGTWTGGEYCYGQYLQGGSGGNAVRTDSTFLLDGGFASSLSNIGKRAGTVRCEGLPGQSAGDKWGFVFGQAFGSAAAAIDSSGRQMTRILGGFRGGPVARAWASFAGNNTSGFVPMYPINIWHHEDGPGNVRLLGHMPDVRGVNLLNFSAEEEVTIGSDVWVFFPSSRRTLDGVNDETDFQGIAYKKVTT